MAASPYISDATGDTFQALVIERSQQVPVVVDFWASWCAPCRSLMPILAKLADEYQGRFLLVKVDTDEHQALAGKNGIRSLPTVRLFKHGKSVDEFMGALPESGVRAFIDKHLPRAADALLAASMQAMQQGDIAQARALAEKALADDARYLPSLLHLIHLEMQHGDIDQATALLTRVPADQAHDVNVLELGARLNFARALNGAPPEAELLRLVAADANNHLARYQLGSRHVLAGHYEAALETFFDLMKRDRKFNDDAARKAIVAVFDLLGGRGPLVNVYRAKLASILN